MGKGIHVQSVMQWLTEILLLGKPPARPPVPESSDPTDFMGGSPNMKLLFSVATYVYACFSRRGLQAALKRMDLIMKRELLAHGNGEPISASHGQLWHGGMGAALLVAVKFEHASLVQKAAPWLQIDHAILRTLEHEGEPWTPGGRGFMGQGDARTMIGTNPSRRKLLAAIRGERIGGKVNQYDLGALCLAKLTPEMLESIRKWPESFPPMWGGGFEARRFADGRFYAYFPGPPWKDAVLSAGWDGKERWLSAGVDRERIAGYTGDPVLTISAPAADEVAFERKPNNPNRKQGDDE
jgi:hypothetical protein